MSKRINRFLTLLFVMALAGGGLLARHAVHVSAAQQASVAKSNTRNAAIVAATSEVLKETSEIRELAILRPVKSGAQSRSEIERMLVKNLNDQMTPAEMHATEVSLRKFGLAPADFEYRSFIIKLLTEQVAGYYDPKVQEFHLADWLDLEGQKPVMAHELTHALQDQHFNLRRFEKWPHGDSDAELAAHALIEGDATLAMTIYMAKNPLVALAFSRSLTTGVATEQYDQAPRAMRESLIFPYLQGSEWTTQLYRRGGWTMVSNAFTRLPLSSEQILHAEKYFSYERPVKVVLPDVTNLLNSRSSQQSAISNQHSTRRRLPTGSWHRIDSDVNGEWTYYLILDEFLKSPAESKRAAAGWAGDRYALYEGANGRVFLAQVAAWDTENDAREFFDAYVKRTELRYPDAKPLTSTDSKFETRNSKLETRNSYSWQTSEGEVVIELRGQRVVILEGVPEGVEASTLLKAL
ncbi:MAG: hypothetical protein ABJC10_12890 [Acidobacteriota bacterium]